MADAARPLAGGGATRCGHRTTGELGGPAAHNHAIAIGQVALDQITRAAESLGRRYIRPQARRLDVGGCVEGSVEGGHLPGVAVGGGDEAFEGNGVFAEAFVVFGAVQHGVNHAIEALASRGVEVSVDFPATKGGTAQDAAVHHLNGFGDVEATPITAPERVRAGHLANEFPQADVAVFELDLFNGCAFAGVAGITKDLVVDSPNHRLGAGLCAANTGLTSPAGHRCSTRGDLLQPHHLGPNAPWGGLAELGRVHLARLIESVANQDPTGVVAVGRRPGGHGSRAGGEDRAVVEG